MINEDEQYTVRYGVNGLEQIQDTTHLSARDALQSAKQFVEYYFTPGAKRAGEKMSAIKNGWAIINPQGGTVVIATVIPPQQMRNMMREVQQFQNIEGMNIDIYKKLKREYNKAVKLGKVEFLFNGRKMVVEYAKYILQYLAPKFDGIKESTSNNEINEINLKTLAVASLLGFAGLNTPQVQQYLNKTPAAQHVITQAKQIWAKIPQIQRTTTKAKQVWDTVMKPRHINIPDPNQPLPSEKDMDAWDLANKYSDRNADVAAKTKPFVDRFLKEEGQPADKKQAVIEKNKRIIDKWRAELKDDRKVAIKMVDNVLSRRIGLSSADLADTATFANGLDEIEQCLENGNYQSALRTAVETANEMLREEGGEGLMGINM